MFWMTSLRPGHSPPQVTTAAVTCSRKYFKSAFSQAPRACQLYYPICLLYLKKMLTFKRITLQCCEKLVLV